VARIVYVNHGMASTLNASLELSRRLGAAGHEVVYLSHRDLRQPVETAGYEFHRLTACDEITERFDSAVRGLGELSTLRKRLRAIPLSRSFRRESLTTPEIEERITDLRPDLAVIDLEMHYAIMATRKLGIPTVLSTVWFSVMRRAGLPPMHTPLPPAQSLGDRVRIQLAWAKLLGARALERATPKWRPTQIRRRLAPVHYGINHVDDLRDLAEARGFDLKGEADWTQWMQPHLYPNLPLLYFNAWEMELPHDPAPNDEYVGPMVFRARSETRMEKAAIRAWQSFRAMSEADGLPLVYCSLGTYWSTDTRFLKRVVEVFARRRDWSLVIGLGGKTGAEALGPLPENVLAMDYAPQLEVLAAASAAVTHGGITSINEAISCGVPLLVYSTSHVDQDGCQVRVVHHGLGLAGDIRSEDTSLLESQLEALLAPGEIRENVLRMKSTFEGYAQRGVAVEAIERLIR